jgi:hypothetical protein
MKTIEAEVELNAKPHEVWAVLTEFGRYGAWNPFITQIEGEPKLGEMITVHVGIGPAAAPIKAEVITFKPDQELAWRSKLIAPGLFDRDHIFRIEPNGTGCKLKQIQTYMGTMAPVAGLLTTEVVRHGLKAMNDALKSRVEHIYNS